MAVLAALVPVVLLAATPAGAASDPDHINFTLEGCRNPSVDLQANNFVCADSDYTTGNMGKTWAELDLVPHRVTLRNDGATQTYSFVVAGDYKNNAQSGTGWDQIHDLVKNAAKSAASCPASPTMGAQTITPGGAGVGGAYQTIYRLVTLAQQAGTTCVYDYTQRLALGAHNFSGSSLQSNLWNQHLTSSGIGQKRIQLPVSEIQPQVLDKTMTASQGVGNDWSLSKSSVLGSGFGDTCDTTQRTTTVTVTVTWTKIPTNGNITVVTQVLASNPAHRDVLVSTTDTVYGTLSGTESVLGSKSVSDVLVPAGASQYELFRTAGVADPFVIIDIDPATTGLRDLAVASYKDAQYPDQVIPGTTSKDLGPISVTQVASGANTTATVSDVETLTGSDFEFKVDTPAPVGTYTKIDSGDNETSYTPGSYTQQKIKWVSGTVSSSGQAVFHKTIRATQATDQQVTLADTATLVSGTGGDQITRTANDSVSTTPSATVSVVISKSMNQTFTSNKVFTFSFTKESDSSFAGSTTITIPAGSTGPVTGTVTGLDPGTTYTVSEPAVAPFAPQTINGVRVDLPSCSLTQEVTNNAEPARARVRKITDPNGSTSWSFTLSRNGTAIETTTATANAGYIDFASSLDVDGTTYTITETKQTNWDLTSIVGDVGGSTGRVTTNTTSGTCSFKLNLTTDSDAIFECTFTNVQRGHVTVTKTVSGEPIPSGSPYSFEFTLNPGNISRTADGSNGGVLDFGYLVPGTTYTLCELNLGAGWSSTWQYFNGTTTVTVTPYNPDAPSQDFGTRCYDFVLAAGGTAAFTIDNQPPPGGGQRTIGYWKNWNSVNRSAAFLARHPDHYTVDDFVPSANITLGQVHVNTVQKAVDILSDASTKYAEHGLAAQLLAAKLNVLAGAAPTCTNITSWITRADSLLSGINWTDSNYQTTRIVDSKDSRRANFLAAHTVLDAYNNGTCPANPYT